MYMETFSNNIWYNGSFAVRNEKVYKAERFQIITLVYVLMSLILCSSHLLLRAMLSIPLSLSLHDWLQYKLMHTYNDSTYSQWYSVSEEFDEDDDLTDTDSRCAQQFITGDFLYWLFDLESDPYETTNLYYSEEQEHVDARTELYALLPSYEDKAR